MAMANLSPFKKHHYGLKYPIVWLQERCEIALFKLGHPVYPISILVILLYSKSKYKKKYILFRR